MKKPQQFIIIDDDQTNNLICSHVIKKFNSNAEVILFQDPDLALESFLNDEEKLNDKNQTVMFLDLNMPSMSGWEFLDVLEKNKPEILQHAEIYILSSSIEDFSQQMEQYPYMAGFISKPLTKDILQEIALKKEKA